MSTRNNPGRFDCYARAEPDEPRFTLLGRDRHAPELIERWARWREVEGEDVDVVNEALQVASACVTFRAKREAKRDTVSPNTETLVDRVEAFLRARDFEIGRIDHLPGTDDYVIRLRDDDINGMPVSLLVDAFGDDVTFAFDGMSPGSWWAVTVRNGSRRLPAEGGASVPSEAQAAAQGGQSPAANGGTGERADGGGQAAPQDTKAATPWGEVISEVVQCAVALNFVRNRNNADPVSVGQFERRLEEAVLKAAKLTEDDKDEEVDAMMANARMRMLQMDCSFGFTLRTASGHLIVHEAPIHFDPKAFARYAKAAGGKGLEAKIKYVADALRASAESSVRKLFEERQTMANVSQRFRHRAEDAQDYVALHGSFSPDWGSSGG